MKRESAIPVTVRRYLSSDRRLLFWGRFLRLALPTAPFALLFLYLAFRIGLLGFGGSFVLLLMLSFVGLPMLVSCLLPGRELAEIDQRIDAKDGLITLARHRHGGPAAELLGRQLSDLVGESGPVERQERQRSKLLRKLLLYAVVLLLCYFVFPGHGPGDGPLRADPPSMPPSGALAGGGTGPGGQGKGQTERDRGQESREDSPSQPEHVPPKKDKRKKKDAPRLPPKDPSLGKAFRDFVVFPDFDLEGRRAAREAPRIRRSVKTAPQRSAAAQTKRASAKKRPETLRSPPLERQVERAIERGVLDPWEGRWLRRYSELLRAQKRGAGRFPSPTGNAGEQPAGKQGK